MESVLTWWQVTSLCGIVSWILVASHLNLTKKIRSLVQFWVTRQVINDTPLILQIQNYQHKFLDAFFSGLSCVVSVPFYTAFLPFLFWSGHGKLARQMTLLMAFCDYLGNAVKAYLLGCVVGCVPRGMYLVHYILSYYQLDNGFIKFAGVAFVCLLVGLIGIGRIYLGMHSLIDIIGGLAMGLLILSFWLKVHEYIDNFIVSGQNVTSFWAALSFLLLFAYPTPEFPTPSFEFHTAFNGVALGIVAGVQQTYSQFHHEAVPRLFTSEFTGPVFIGRILVGLPTILLVKFCSKALAKWMLPVISHTLGVPIKSTSYIPMLNGSVTGNKSDKIKQTSYAHKLFFFSGQETFDVDTGIRFFQYAGLAWSVVDLVPSVFSHLRL
ncbi:hypothetical protein Patl1_32895 [Pistacia atlantica]|uniref:Uncharacterized protein n=1 Tax=Pistacia atlantica TaxID=434234 RepID=A0ACC1ANT3_9ROSI|nr:hypothetical protein Patl1_32895 [Pistacia atlantica]